VAPANANEVGDFDIRAIFVASRLKMLSRHGGSSKLVTAVSAVKKRSRLR
jgi:hypothetical protein